MQKIKIYKNKLVFILFLLLIGLCAYYFLFSEKSAYKKVSYSEFYESVNQNEVIKAELSENKILYELKDGTKLETQNPSSPSLKEFMLLHDVEIQQQADSSEIISTVFDVIFYLFFFGIIIIAFRKFISPNTFKVVHKTGVKFENIVGMENIKKDMTQIVKMMQNPAEYAKKGMRLPKGLLLEGAPGNGKTLFAKALAGESKVNFIPAKATDFESMFMAIGPMKVKLLFRKARKKAPCIVFIDEFDGIGTVRNYSGSAIETENTRIVTALLNELDGFEKTDGVLVIAATNSIKALDPALIRPGRFDAKLTVPYPDFEARKQLVQMYCKGKNPASECSPEKLAKMFENFSCAKIETVLNRASLIANQQEKNEFTLSDITKAMLEV
ncbi:MAG: ATP-dependent metallopeptidase FtsH/Yme1/Tma family protein [Treponema sp.]|nr:ATP-dependent metallopeptidase FtsH/Yme1/Tma family protein [Spirochaetales bacterium]MDY4833335.1 ATP-dependent metallopeptidase FtsH/Yme1/Tma family protein [Treponema sp.]MDY6189991.1 ATP-dependent metallopeptidase FtsH/Yme1/Tma family protein [Treponema sp.]